MMAAAEICHILRAVSGGNVPNAVFIFCYTVGLNFQNAVRSKDLSLKFVVCLAHQGVRGGSRNCC